MGTGLPLSPVVDLDVDTLLSRVVVSTFGHDFVFAVANGTDFGAAVVQVVAPKPNALALTGVAQIEGIGTNGLSDFVCLLTATNGSSVVSDTLMVSLSQPLMPGQTAMLDAFQLVVPQPGSWELTLNLWSPDHGALGPEFKTQLWSSGLGHEMTLSWWGDQNVDTLVVE